MCAVCGKEIGRDERRFADRNRITRVERHVHLGCLPKPGAKSWSNGRTGLMVSNGTSAGHESS
jgi:hypothetical protein